MIAFSLLGKKGNLGNQLFQIASTIGIAKKNNHDFLFPYWPYSYFFEHQIPMGAIDSRFKTIAYKEFEYIEKEFNNENYDIEGWLQTEYFFDIKATKHFFKFNQTIQKDLLKKHAFLFNKPTILITVRRGDFVNNPKFYQLSYKYYFAAILEFFPLWEEKNLIFTSDDIGYCKKHFKSLKNVFFIDNLSAMEQLILTSNCDDFIISNSTFSWWAAWLGEKENSKVICPIKNFSKEYTLENDKDYYPKRWIKFDYIRYKIPIKYYKIYLIGNLYETWKNFKYKAKKIKFINSIVKLLK